MHTNTKYFTRNPLELCLLCFCCVIFVYLLNTSKQIQERQESINHQYLTFAGYAIRSSFTQNPIVSPDDIVWKAEEPFLAEEARLTTIIDVSIKQLTEGFIPEGAGENAKPIPLGENQRRFVEERLDEASARITQLMNERAIAMTAAKKERDAIVATMIRERYQTLLAELNKLFELKGPFFFIYYPNTDNLYTDSSVAEEETFQTLRLLKTHRTVATNAYINLISIDKEIQLGAYMPANYTNPIVLKTIKDSIPTIVLTLVFPCVICSFFASSFLRAHRQKELSYRIKRATHLVQDFNEKGKDTKTQKRKRYHDFRSDNPIDLALYGASDRNIVNNQGSLVDGAPITPPNSSEQVASLGLSGQAKSETAPKKYQQKGHLSALGKVATPPMEIISPNSVLYGALWVHNFLSLDTTPIRKQLDRHTQVPTRIMFLQILQELWTKKKYLHAPIFLAHFDVDNLEEANHLLGYTAGNTIIYTMIHIINTKLEKNGLIGRLSSDNFICVYVGSKEEFTNIIMSTLHEINAMSFDGSAVHTPSASVGITEITENDHSIDDGQRRALAALYQAKNDGKNCYREI